MSTKMLDTAGSELATLRALEPLCWRAPSAHNTQPWRLTYGTGEVEVGWYAAYALPAADPTDRDLRLSVGAFVETCLIVAADTGVNVEFWPDYSRTARRVGWLRPAQFRYRTAFDAAAVAWRGTDRGTYVAGPSREVVTAADAVAASAGGAVRELASPAVGTLIPTADRQVYADRGVLRDLRSWLRLSPRHPRYRMDGLTDSCLGLSRVEATMLRGALAASPALHPVGLPRLLATASGDPLRRGGTVLVLIGPVGRTLEEMTQVEFGRVLMRVWLTLSTAGLACHPLSQLIDVAETRTALAAALSVDPERLLHVARVGRPERPAPRSARRVPRATHQPGP